MYSRIMRRTTCEEVRSSCAHSRSNSAFLRGSIRIRQTGGALFQLRDGGAFHLHASYIIG